MTRHHVSSQIPATPAPADRLTELALITDRLAELGTQIATLSGRRKLLVEELSHDGYSHARIAQAAGVSRGRVFQLLESTRAGGVQ